MCWAAGLGVLGLILLLVMLIGLLAWAVPSVPWWGWSGILGGTLCLSAGVLYHLGKQQFASINPLQDQSAQAAKESVEWISHQVTTPSN
jgi:hypothetical protein